MRIWYHYRRLDLGRRIALRVLIAFLLTFVVLRLITAIIHYELFPHGPFRNLVTASGLHIHHLFWGILLLMLTGFVALATRAERWHLRIAVIFGIALGLTLDEYASPTFTGIQRALKASRPAPSSRLFSAFTPSVNRSGLRFSAISSIAGDDDGLADYLCAAFALLRTHQPY